MRTPTTVSIDDDFASREAGITLGSANDELAGRIDVQVSVVPKERDGWLAVLEDDFLQGCLDDILNDGLVHVFHAWCSHLRASVSCPLLAAHSLGWLSMLSGDKHSVDLLWLHRAILLLQILNGYLGLAIGSQPPQLPILAHFGELVAQRGRHGVGQWHSILCLITGIAKHDAL